MSTAESFVNSHVVSTSFPWSSVLLLKANGCDLSLCPRRLCSLQETRVPYTACKHHLGVREGGWREASWLRGTDSWSALAITPSLNPYGGLCYYTVMDLSLGSGKSYCEYMYQSIYLLYLF